MNFSKEFLLTPCKDFDFDNPPFDATEFSKELVKFMYEKNGLGLAANQVGYNYNIFAMRGSPQNFVCFNPIIVDFSEKVVKLEEGCLSYPGLIIPVKRPKSIRVRFRTPNGETRTEKFVGLAARVFQHEMDHLEGNKFYNKANKYHIDRAFRKLK